ncbi:MAG TPA: response regulator [Polyangiaceae bacterium]|nr:response regulator [Polyangiaceae bacterium]
MPGVRTILLVEDEQILRLSMARGLGKLPGVKVSDAGTVAEAKRLLVSAPPDLVISDLDLPDGSGIEVAAELERLGLRAPIVFVSAFVGKYKHRLPASGDVEIYEKPVALDRLRAVAEEKLGLSDTAALSPFGIADYVQLAGMGRHSVVIEVRSMGGHGRIVIKSGELWTADDRLGAGMDAFRRLVFLGAAQVTCRTLRKNELPPRDIGRSAQSVLLEVAKTFDEAERDAGAAPDAIDDGWGDTFLDADGVRRSSRPPPDGSSRPPRPNNSWRPPSLRPPPPPRAPSEFPPRDVPTKVSARGNSPFAAAFERGVDALLAKDYARAHAAFVEANKISPDDRRVLANLERLRKMGFT